MCEFEEKEDREGEEDRQGEEEGTVPTEESKKSCQKGVRIQRNNKEERQI